MQAHRSAARRILLLLLALTVPVLAGGLLGTGIAPVAARSSDQHLDTIAERAPGAATLSTGPRQVLLNASRLARLIAPGHGPALPGEIVALIAVALPILSGRRTGRPDRRLIPCRVSAAPRAPPTSLD